MKNKNFIIIVIGQIISLFGNAIQRFSMSLYLLEFTGSTATFANILAISTIPYILFAPIAGMLSDRVNKKKIMVYLDFFCSFLIGGYAIILLNGRDHEVIVAIVMFMLSICFTLYGPAVTSSIPQIVEEDKLTSANGVINQVGSIVNFAGPILAGVLYGIVGIKAIVIINAISFFASAIMELFLDIPDLVVNEDVESNNVVTLEKNAVPTEVESKVESNNVVTLEKNIVTTEVAVSALDIKESAKVTIISEKAKEDIRGKKEAAIASEGIKENKKATMASENIKGTAKREEKILSIEFIKNSFIDMGKTFKYLSKEKKVVLGIIASYALCNIFLVPVLTILAPYFINIFLGLPSEIYGIVEGICVLGMILGGFWISVKPNMFKIKKVHYTYLPMVAGVILMSTLDGIKANNYTIAFLFAIGGLAIMMSLSLSNVLTLTFIQKEVPLEMLGRVSAFSTAVATISVAPGQLLYGQIIDTGMPIGLILLITAIANIVLVMFVKWNVREIN
ncbi:MULTISPECIES: MFS transporter [Clostridium]|jgi:MFS family permease|uniref:MFS transporter n=1 Tax=Clostridium TaxID=1485 RepID=UPI0022E6A09A|nr:MULTISPECIES: MFS transporter [Clostridium]MDB1934463.1 MFS transporter [Clostridium tertium]MDB1937673.1 MFS transporter [Clostridium tertium]MDB1969771.1 MFS transporter [Clostridium tertium]MDU2459227.1 MFS transporter [Clostridium sp.]MDU3526270.1 MFS transporter [Clostridium sp.]